MGKSKENNKKSASENKKELQQLINCILKDLLGDNELEAFYFHLKVRKNVDRENIIEKFDEFLSFIKEIFNALSDQIIIRFIVEIQKKYNVKLHTIEDLLDFVKRITSS
ncbi:MAG: hypothetical protein RXR31_01995 [Thermoproteota archaeon]|jgi:hypothetical protein